MLILTSSQQGLDLLSRALINPGEWAALENPVYLGARAVFAGRGARIHGLPVDQAGAGPAALERCSGEIKLIYLTPSHQYPLGTRLSLARRRQYLNWAATHGSWIVEDDYNSELCYEGRPIAALQGLDQAEKVIYFGTFSKSVFPALRIAYLVLPHSLITPMIQLRRALDGHTAVFAQACLAEFLEDGGFLAHFRKMRASCKARSDLLLQVFENHGHAWSVSAHEGGFHLILNLPQWVGDTILAETMARSGWKLDPLSAMYLGKPCRRGLILGYAGLPQKVIAAAGGDFLAATMRALNAWKAPEAQR